MFVSLWDWMQIKEAKHIIFCGEQKLFFRISYRDRSWIVQLAAVLLSYLWTCNDF